MVHRLVNIAKTRQSGVCTPLVGPYRCAGSYNMLDDWQQRPGVTVMYQPNYEIMINNKDSVNL